MTDLEKVIKGLEMCIKDIECTGCPYEGECFDENDDRQFGESMMRDALVLLKEQEAKTGHWIDTTKVIGFPRVQCSVCGSGQGAIWMNHCPNCGAKMEGQ